MQIERLVAGVALLVSTLPGCAPTQPETVPTPDRRAVPILMYHVVGDPPGEALFPQLYVSHSELRNQVDWLVDAGYEAVTLGRVVDAWNGRATLPRRPIVLSFDDGYRSHVTAALPILAARRWPGVLNLDLSNLALPGGSAPRAFGGSWPRGGRSTPTR